MLDVKFTFTLPLPLSDVVAPKRAVFSDLQCNVESEFDEVAPKRAVVSIFCCGALSLHQLELPCAKRDQCILHTSPA